MLEVTPDIQHRSNPLGMDDTQKKWYAREDLNLHVLGHQNLNLARLPIPPLAHVRENIIGSSLLGKTEL